MLRHSVFTFLLVTPHCGGLVCQCLGKCSNPNLQNHQYTESSHQNKNTRLYPSGYIGHISYLKGSWINVYLQAQLDYESGYRRRRHNLHQETTSPLVTETNRDRGDKLVIDKNCNATLATTQASNQPLDTNTQLLQGESLCAASHKTVGSPKVIAFSTSIHRAKGTFACHL